jgi:PmbA protein
MVERAREIARHVAQDPANRLADDPGSPESGLTLSDPRLADLPARKKIEIASAVEEAARAADRRVSAVREAAYHDGTDSVHIANTRGLSFGFTESRAHLSCELAATEGEHSQTGWHVGWRFGFEGLDPVRVGAEAARKAAVKLGARPAETARTMVVLSPEVTANLFGELAALFFADAVVRGRSMLQGRMGETIASSLVTLVDDGRHPDGYGSAPVDGEGSGSRQTVLIDRGVLRGYLHSAYTAAKMETAVTGNALRGGYGARPGIGCTNLILHPTGISRDSLIGGVTDGLYVMEVMGLHTINPVTGDFSLAASGLTIDSGRLAAPVDRMAVSGNILPLLSSIEAVADDLQFLAGGVGATMLLRDISVSGR